MLFLFSTPASIRHLWPLIFLYWYLLYAVILGLCQIHWSYALIIFPAGFTSHEVLNKDLTGYMEVGHPNKSSNEFYKLKFDTLSIPTSGNTKEESITVLLTSCLTGLDKFVLQIKT